MMQRYISKSQVRLSNLADFFVNLFQDYTHRIAEGKYLKYLYFLHEKRGTLDVSDVASLCGACNMRKNCETENSVEK
jgi:hypothetical protein